jgi:hypothetical protein
LVEAESAMVSVDWDSCVAACESGLREKSGVNDADLTGKLEALLGLSTAHQKLLLGKNAMGTSSFESAIDSFEAGLAQKTSAKGDDGGIAAKLETALAEASAAKIEQDNARVKSWSCSSEGELLLAGEIAEDSIERAIALFEAGLALKATTNGEHGWESGKPDEHQGG